jgi:hypothetical protein
VRRTRRVLRHRATPPRPSASLSGASTLDDFTCFLRGYQTGGTSWFTGDFDYSGLVTLDDFTLFLSGYQRQGTPL